MEQSTKTIEVRSAMNDNVVLSFSHTEESETNIFTAGYKRICQAFNINRVDAESRYYISAN